MKQALIRFFDPLFRWLTGYMTLAGLLLWANEQRMVFAGSATTVISLAATLANAANTYDGLASLTMNNLDNSTNLYPWAKAVLDIADTFAAAPSAGATVELYMVEQDIDGTNDGLPAVDGGSDLRNAVFVGAFPIDDADVAHRVAIVISLEGVKNAKFYIKNNTGQTISYSTNAIRVYITPFSYAPA